MNAGQEQFRNFILSHVKEDAKDKAEALLNEGFAKQEDGSFDRMYLLTFIPRMLPLIKEESIQQVKDVMAKFQEKF